LAVGDAAGGCAGCDRAGREPINPSVRRKIPSRKATAVGKIAR
jgi:hypothetical protein